MPTSVRGWIVYVGAGCAVVACLAGMWMQSSRVAPGGVAIVDLDAVAKQLGTDTEIEKSVQQWQDELNKQLLKAQAVAKDRLDKKHIELSGTDTPESAAEIAKLQEQLAVTLQQMKRNATNNLSAFRQQEVGRFRERLKPAIKQVAAARGLSTVIPKDERLLLSIDPSVDITDAVIAAVKASPLPAAPATPPALVPAKAPEKTAEAESADQPVKN